jgi:hypothetical protein
MKTIIKYRLLNIATISIIILYGLSFLTIIIPLILYLFWGITGDGIVYSFNKKLEKYTK